MAGQVPAFSIIIPTGSRVSLAAMAVRSVLTQTLQDFEIIISDWADTEEARALAASDKRIVYVRAVSDTPYGGWNISVRKARGEYLLWLDDDNYLLPYSLELLDRTIAATHADVVTSTHLYYYDDLHPRRYLRNSLGVIPYSSATRTIDPKELLKAQFAFKRSSSLPRLHTSATAVARRVVQASLDKLGFIIIDRLPNIHSMFPILMSFARTGVFVDHPTVIVGRYGNSLSQDWAHAAQNRFKKQAFPIAMSPVKGYTRINSTMENYLTVKKILPEFYRDVPIDFAQFAKIYIQELAYLDSDVATFIKNWRGLFAFIKTFPPETRKPLARKALKFALLAPIVYASRRLMLYPIWRRAVAAASGRGNTQSATEKIRGTREFVIPLRGKYPVDSIGLLAEHVRSIMIAETQQDIFSLPR